MQRRLTSGWRTSAGFSLLELMTVVIILGVGLALALPDLSSFIRRNQISSATNELMSAMTLARAEAIKRGAPVVICASSDSTTPAPTCTGAWNEGYIVFVDTNADALRQPAEEVLRTSPAAPARVVVDRNGGEAQIRFAPNGMLSGLSAGTRLTVRNTSSPSGAKENRVVCVALAGRASALDERSYDTDPRFAACRALP